MFKHILVPTDGSELSQEAIRNAVPFAKEMNAKITAFYTKPEFDTTQYAEGSNIDPLAMKRFEEATEAEAQKILGFAEKLCQETGVPCETLSLTNNNPYEAIIEAAKQSGCDLVFMASHGRKGLKGFLLGSETQKVLMYSTIPVLVYRSPVK